MKRFRLSTLLRLVVIAAVVVALVVLQYRAARREVEVEREVLIKYGLMGKASSGKEVAKQEAARLRSVVESAKAKEGDEE
jgi:hypothetical protein